MEEYLNFINLMVLFSDVLILPLLSCVFLFILCFKFITFQLSLIYYNIVFEIYIKNAYICLYSYPLDWTETKNF